MSTSLPSLSDSSNSAFVSLSTSFSPCYSSSYFFPLSSHCLAFSCQTEKWQARQGSYAWGDGQVRIGASRQTVLIHLRTHTHACLFSTHTLYTHLLCDTVIFDIIPNGERIYHNRLIIEDYPNFQPIRTSLLYICMYTKTLGKKSKFPQRYFMLIAITLG